MSESHPRRREKVLPADLTKQKPNNSYTPVNQYEDQRVACSDCGKMILWTARQQQTWYEEMKASIYAEVNLRCDICRKRGKHDLHRRAQRAKKKGFAR